jgi:hypothetical protein
MSEVKVNKISPRTNCGTVQLGDSGDTITIPAGATIVNNGTQTGFGRTGTVDWDTTAKTASFTAVSGNGYFVNTTSGAITVTLPAGSAGDIVGISDYASTFQTNNVTITPNGTDKINGVNENATLSTQGIAVSLVYVDATRGWKSVTGSDNDTTGVSPAFVTATGGTVTCCGDYKIHTFTGPGTFTVTCAGNPTGSNTVSYIVVAGGGGGGGANMPNGNYASGAGGGAGGFREGKSTFCGYTASPLATTGLSVTASAFPIVIGGGGANAPATGEVPATTGSNSVFSTITSTGGGGGSSHNSSSSGGPGGSGGGGAYSSNAGGIDGGNGNTPPVSPPQGNPGGTGNITGCYPSKGANGAGGGGATAVGANTIITEGGDGGAGATTNINGSPTAFAGGGGGGVYKCGGCQGANGSGAGGTGGGGPGGPAAGSTATGNGQNGTANTGGGAGGGSTGNNGGSGPATGGTGGSGIVIIRYKYQ